MMKDHIMKICHLTSAHPRDDIRIFVKQCLSMAQEPYNAKVYLIVADGNGDCKKNGVTIIDAGGRTGSNRLSRITTKLKGVYAQALKVDAEIYQFHDPELLPVGFLLSKLHKKMVVYDVHEDFPRAVFSPSRDYIPLSLKPLVSFIFEKVENFVAQQISAIVCATSYIGQRFQTLNRKTVVLNNYPLLDELNQSTSTSWENREQAVVYIGGISKERGLIQMVGAMNKIPHNRDGKLRLFGSYSSKEVRNEAVASPGWQYVEEYGQVNRKTLAKALAKNRAGLVLFHPDPNHINAQPNKMFEYMSAGLPVIASDFPLWRAIIDDAGCGILVDPMNEQEIADAINFIFSNPAKAASMGRCGLTAITNKYNWATESKQLFKLYQGLIL